MHKHLEELIRGEIAAVKAYDVALEKIQDTAETEQINAIKADHADAIVKLKQFADEEVKEETKSAGPWGTFATTFTAGGSLFGDKGALKALKIGEEHGVNEYKEALQDDELDSQLRSIISTELLPRQERHLGILDRRL